MVVLFVDTVQLQSRAIQLNSFHNIPSPSPLGNTTANPLTNRIWRSDEQSQLEVVS